MSGLPLLNRQAKRNRTRSEGRNIASRTASLNHGKLISMAVHPSNITPCSLPCVKRRWPQQRALSL